MQAMEFLKNTFGVFALSTQLLFLLAFAIIIAFLLFKATHREDNAIDWTDIITDTSGSGKLSSIKVGQMIGLLISSWVVVSLTERNSLSFDIFGLYLAFVGGGAGWSSYLKAKFNTNPKVPPKSKEPPTDK